MSDTAPRTGIFLMAHGAPESTDDIPEYLKTIRGGRDSTPETIQIIRDRYEQIGGKSPLREITAELAERLEKFLNQEEPQFKVYVGMRNWSPYIRDEVKRMKEDGIEKVIALCLAPQFSTWSTKLYFNAFEDALKECGGENIDVHFVASWANHPLLIDAFSEKYREALAKLNGESVYTIFTAHSIPSESIDLGDPYDQEFNKTVELLVDRVKPNNWYQAYQSQGMIPVPWLGPTVESVLDKISRVGSKTVLIVPVGFVCDHVEILFDIDIEFKNYAVDKKLKLHRTESLNFSPTYIEALASIAWETMV
ncbi:MAG TPA: ferrochelatase [Nitrospina sp.]|nr:ferrochelatase [Nitrospina sp.]|tara:strand:+ start:3267 stop:4190 length:924 start_codon:yes stop_codon:yes gene_type:complete